MKKLVVMMFFMTGTVFADSFFISTPKLIGAKDELKKVVRELIVHEVENSGHEILGNKKDSKFVIESTLMKLDVSYLLTVSLRGAETRSKKMKLKDLDDIDVTISRVVRSVLKNKSIKASRKVEEITKQEQDNRFKKLKVDRLWVVGLGTAFLNGMDADSAYNTTIGYIWGIESYFDLFTRVDYSNASGSSNAGIFQLMIGGNYYFTDSVHAPFVSLHFGYAKAKSENDRAGDLDETDGDGWAVGGGVGMKFFRASTVNFGVEGRYTIVTTDLLDNQNERNLPGQLALSFLIFF